MAFLGYTLHSRSKTPPVHRSEQEVVGDGLTKPAGASPNHSGCDS